MPFQISSCIPSLPSATRPSWNSSTTGRGIFPIYARPDPFAYLDDCEASSFRQPPCPPILVSSRLDLSARSNQVPRTEEHRTTQASARKVLVVSDTQEEKVDELHRELADNAALHDLDRGGYLEPFFFFFFCDGAVRDRYVMPTCQVYPPVWFLHATTRPTCCTRPRVPRAVHSSRGSGLVR